MTEIDTCTHSSSMCNGQGGHRCRCLRGGGRKEKKGEGLPQVQARGQAGGQAGRQRQQRELALLGPSGDPGAPSCGGRGGPLCARHSTSVKSRVTPQPLARSQPASEHPGPHRHAAMHAYASTTTAPCTQHPPRRVHRAAVAPLSPQGTLVLDGACQQEHRSQQAIQLRGSEAASCSRRALLGRRRRPGAGPPQPPCSVCEVSKGDRRKL